MKRTLDLLALATFVLFSGIARAPDAEARGLADEIPLPNGWQPEGITIGPCATIYSGSIATGAVFRADLRTGAGDVLVPGRPGRVAVGLKLIDGRTSCSSRAARRAQPTSTTRKPELMSRCFSSPRRPTVS